jgi:hypothetical protein
MAQIFPMNDFAFVNTVLAPVMIDQGLDPANPSDLLVFIDMNQSLFLDSSGNLDFDPTTVLANNKGGSYDWDDRLDEAATNPVRITGLPPTRQLDQQVGLTGLTYEQFIAAMMGYQLGQFVDLTVSNDELHNAIVEIQQEVLRQNSQQRGGVTWGDSNVWQKAAIVASAAPTYCDKFAKASRGLNGATQGLTGALFSGAGTMAMYGAGFAVAAVVAPGLFAAAGVAGATTLTGAAAALGAMAIGSGAGAATLFVAGTGAGVIGIGTNILEKFVQPINGAIQEIAGNNLAMAR